MHVQQITTGLRNFAGSDAAKTTGKNTEGASGNGEHPHVFSTQGVHEKDERFFE